METGLNASACVDKQPIMVATASTEHPIGCCLQAVVTMIGCLPTQALAFSPVFIQTQRTQRKRLRLEGNRALDCKTTALSSNIVQARQTLASH